jgi:acyl-CoA dehydrogenase
MVTKNAQFGLTEEQRQLQQLARDFAQGEIAPVAAHFDKVAEFPRDIIKKAHALGLLNLIQPAECSASGLGLFDACLVIEELAAACSGFATSMVANDLALTPIRVGGTPEQHQKFITPIAKSGASVSFCLTEPGAGSDAGGLSTQAARDGDYYVLNGAKQWITNGGVAAQYTVFATLDKAKKHKGICCFVVPADTPGISRGSHEDKMGQRCSDTVALNFENVRIPASHLIESRLLSFRPSSLCWLTCILPLKVHDF